MRHHTIRRWPTGVLTTAMIVGAAIAGRAYASLPPAAKGPTKAHSFLSASGKTLLPTTGSSQITVSTPFVHIGQPIRWSARGLTPDTTLNLMWETVQGKWQLSGQDNERLVGDTYTFGRAQIGTVHTTAQGTAKGTFTAPAGFGGPHPFGLALPHGRVEAVGTVIETVSASIGATTEPQGRFFTLHVTGLGYGGGYDAYMAEYGVLYDNHYMGFISGVTTQGVATFRVRAEGVGPHVISLLDSPVEGPYLNVEQSPYAWFSQYSFPVTVTPGVPTDITSHLPSIPAVTGNHITVTPGSGPVGTRFTLAGTGLLPNRMLQVVWFTMVGNRVTASGFTARPVDLGTVRTNTLGSFRLTMRAPLDLGGPPHTVDLVSHGKVVGSGSFRIVPHFVATEPTVVQAGHSFIVHLTGVGWTQYDNIYAVDYDNAYTGYGCGFNSAGDVKLVLRAGGLPGYHFIDIYPSPYQSSSHFPNWYGMPQLTYAQDHPGDRLPAFHLVIRVVP